MSKSGLGSSPIGQWYLWKATKLNMKCQTETIKLLGIVLMAIMIQDYHIEGKMSIDLTYDHKTKCPKSGEDRVAKALIERYTNYTNQEV